VGRPQCRTNPPCGPLPPATACPNSPVRSPLLWASRGPRWEKKKDFCCEVGPQRFKSRGPRIQKLARTKDFRESRKKRGPRAFLQHRPRGAPLFCAERHRFPVTFNASKKTARRTIHGGKIAPAGAIPIPPGKSAGKHGSSFFPQRFSSGTMLRNIFHRSLFDRRGSPRPLISRGPHRFSPAHLDSERSSPPSDVIPAAVTVAGEFRAGTGRIHPHCRLSTEQFCGKTRLGLPELFAGANICFVTAGTNRRAT